MDSLSSVGLIKLIRVMLRPGHRDGYLASQAVWNRASRVAPGYLGEIVGAGETDEFYVITFWRSRDEYEQWMDRDHDRIAALAAADAHYEALDIRLIDGV